MAIHRVGPAPDTTPFQRDLGPILVTIDDLDALMVLLTQHLGSQIDRGVEFTGGYFTDAQDLRRLSDEELESLRIKTGSLEIHLSNERAIVIGNEQEAQEVYRLWARPRINLLLGAPSQFTWGLGLLGLLLAAVLTVLDILRLFDTPGLIAAALAVVSGALLPLSNKFKENGLYASIKPVSLDEYRQRRASNRWPMLAVFVAMAAIAFGTATAFLVPLLTGD